MSSKPNQNLTAWLKCIPVDQQLADPFELAVAQGLAAMETIAEQLRDSLCLGEIESPAWLKAWAMKLTTEEIETIQARRDAEQAALQEDIECLLGDDPMEWTAAEKAHAIDLQRRISAVNLVLSAREGQAANAA